MGETHGLPSLLALIIAFAMSTPALAAVQAGGGTDTVKCVLQMQYDPPTLPLPVVSVRIGDSKPMLFLVDTGSNAAVTLTHWAAGELRLDKLANGVRSDKSIDGKNYDEYRFAPTLLCIVGAAPGSTNLGINATDIDCARDDFEIADTNFRTPRLAGTLGINFWCNFTLQFDFAEKTLSVFVDHPNTVNGAPAAPQPLVVTSAATPLTLRPWPGFEPIPQVRLSDPRTGADGGLTNDASPTNPLPSDQWLVVDTGSDATDFPETLRRSDSVSPRLGSMVHQHNQKIFAQKQTLSSLTLDGQLTEPNLTVNWFQGSLTPNLGMNFLRRFLVTIDTQHDKLYLQRASDYADASRESGFLGFALRPNPKGNYVVSRIFDDALARRIGIAIGDEILEIDGYSLSQYAYYQVSALEDGFAGTASCLMVRHKNVPTATAVWIVRQDARAKRPATDDKAGPTIRLTHRSSCTVTDASGKVAQVPFRCNPDTPPPGDPVAGSFYQRVQRSDGTYHWDLLPIP